jgi:DNA topoisomerase-1
VRRWLSAGRVQSVALRIIVDREHEIQAFKTEEYRSIRAVLTLSSNAARGGPGRRRTDRSKPSCSDAGRGWPENPRRGSGSKPRDAESGSKEDGRLRAPKLDIHNEDEARAILRDLGVDERSLPSLIAEGATIRPATGSKVGWRVVDVRAKEKKKNPAPPFTTSKLQQDAARRHGFPVARTMRIAQILYEGKEVGDRGSVGLITYMRTDSTRVSDEALSEVRAYIASTYGDKALPEKPRYYKSAKDAQEAHEAIRPTFLDLPPEAVAAALAPEELKLYSLIWNLHRLADGARGLRHDDRRHRGVGANGRKGGRRVSLPGVRLGDEIPGLARRLPGGDGGRRASAPAGER